MSHILSTVLLLASCSIGAGASALIDGDGVSIVGGSTKLVTRSTVPIILSPGDFNITVTDISGHSDGIQSREPNQAHGAPSNHKRDVSRAIDTCPPGVPHFIRSTCDHTSGSLNFKSYKLTCSSFDPGAIVTRLIAFPDPITPGSCGPNEFCFQNNHNQNAPVAYCVSQTNMITLVAAGASPSGASQMSLDITGPAQSPWEHD